MFCGSLLTSSFSFLSSLSTSSLNCGRLTGSSFQHSSMRSYLITIKGMYIYMILQQMWSGRWSFWLNWIWLIEMLFGWLIDWWMNWFIDRYWVNYWLVHSFNYGLFDQLIYWQWTIVFLLHVLWAMTWFLQSVSFH